MDIPYEIMGTQSISGIEAGTVHLGEWYRMGPPLDSVQLRYKRPMVDTRYNYS